MAPRELPPDEPSDEHDVDAQWQDIVTRLGDLSSPDVPADGATALPADQGPASPPRRRKTDLPGARTIRPAQGSPDQDATSGAPDQDATSGAPDQDATSGAPDLGADPRAWAPDPAVEEAEDHFVPPDPGPVFGGDPLITMAWIAVAAAPTLALLALIVWRDMPTWLLQVAGVAFVAAVGVLLWRMPQHQDPGGDDTGAVV